MKKILILSAFFASVSAFAGIDLIATCKSVDDDAKSVCVYQQPWDANSFQYVVRWSAGSTCHASPGFSHQFIGDDIKTADAKRIHLKEKSNLFGIFCREKRVFDLDMKSGKATFQVKTSDCSSVAIGDGPHFPGTPQNFKTKMNCEITRD